MRAIKSRSVSGPVRTREVVPASISKKRSAVLAFAGFALSLLIVAITVVVVWTSRQTATSEWRERIDGLAAMVGGHAKQTIEAVDDVLLSIVESLRSQDIDSVEQLTAAVQTKEFNRQLAERIKGAPHIEVLSVISRDGLVLSNSLRYVPPYPFSQWDKLKYILLDAEVDRVFSNVFVTSLQKTDERIIGLGRKVFSKSGRVIAIVGAGIKSSYFGSFYGSLPLRDGYVVSLLNREGLQLAHFGEGLPDLGRKTPYVKFDEQLRAQNRAVFLSETSDDSRTKAQPARLVAMMRVPEISMVATASISPAVYLAQWRRSAIYFSIGGGSFALAIVFLTIATRSLLNKIEEARQAAVVHSGAKSRFLSSISHEMRTPLNAISGSAKIMLDGEIPSETKKFANTILEASRQLLSIVNNTLDFARFEAGSNMFEERNFEVRPVLKTIMDITRLLPGADKLNIRLAIGDDVPKFLQGALDGLKQVALNVLGNAVKFTENGSVELVVVYDYKRSLLRLTVKDTGRGIPRSEHDIIFQAFERGRAAGTNIEGAGLGLSIAKHVVDRLDGKIKLEFSDHTGSCFTIELPMRSYTGEQVAEGEVQSRLSEASESLRILVADDVPAIRLVIGAQLRKLGHSSHLVTNGLEALDAIKRQRFDGVLMDVQMPLMDGLAATRAIRQMPVPANMTPIIGMTALTEAEHFDEPLRAGMDLCLTKPLQIQDFLDALASKRRISLSSREKIVFPQMSINEEELQAVFITDLKAGRDELAACLNDEAVAKRILHKLCGLLANFGKVRIAQLARDAERTCQPADIRAVLDAIDDYLRNSGTSAPS